MQTTARVALQGLGLLAAVAASLTRESSHGFSRKDLEKIDTPIFDEPTAHACIHPKFPKRILHPLR